MRAPGKHKRAQRATMLDAAKEFDALEEQYYYVDDMPETERRFLYKRLVRVQVRLNAAVLAYCLGANKATVAARLKRRAARRKAATEPRLVA